MSKYKNILITLLIAAVAIAIVFRVGPVRKVVVGS